MRAWHIQISRPPHYFLFDFGLFAVTLDLRPDSVSHTDKPTMSTLCETFIARLSSLPHA